MANTIGLSGTIGLSEPFEGEASLAAGSAPSIEVAASVTPTRLRSRWTPPSDDEPTIELSPAEENEYVAWARNEWLRSVGGDNGNDEGVAK